MPPKLSFINQAGLTAVEMLVCLAVMLQMMLLGAGLMRSRYNHWEQTLAARQLNLVSNAAKYYVQDHMEELLENWPEDESQELSIAKLQEENYLPTNFIDQNLFRQSTKIQLRCLTAEDEEGNALPDAPKLVQILTYTVHGQKLSDTQARGIADAIGAEGGYLPSLPFSPKEAPKPPKILVGCCKGWLLDVSTIEDLAPGHPVRLIYVSSVEGVRRGGGGSSSEETFLRRVKSADTSRYNIMETHLGIQDGALIQFLKPGVLEISDTADEESTSIQAHHFRLNKEAYWNEETLHLSEQVSFKENKLIFTDETGDKRLEIGIDGIEFTAPEGSLAFTEESLSLENENGVLNLSPGSFEMQDLKKLGNEISLSLSNGPALNLTLIDNSSVQMVVSSIDLKFSPKDFSPFLNLAWIGEGGICAIGLLGSGGLQILDSDAGAELIISSSDGKTDFTFKEYKAGVTYISDSIQHWPPP